MSTTLHWRLTTPQEGTRLPYALKRILGDSCRSWTEANRPYLQGLADAEVEGAATLLELLDKHGEIETYGVS